MTQVNMADNPEFRTLLNKLTHGSVLLATVAIQGAKETVPEQADLSVQSPATQTAIITGLSALFAGLCIGMQHEDTDTVTQEHIRFVALVLANVLVPTGNSLALEWAVENLRDAASDYERLYGRRPDKFLLSAMVNAIRDGEKESNVPLAAFMAARPQGEMKH